MWILNQLARTVSRYEKYKLCRFEQTPGRLNLFLTSVFSVNSEYEARNLHNVEKELRKFLYGDVCDVYVEYIKQNIQVTCNFEMKSNLG